MKLAITPKTDIFQFRRYIREILKPYGFSLPDVTRIMTAVHELAENMKVHAGGGVVIHEKFETKEHVGIKMTFKDRGPGIANIKDALQRGYSTCGRSGLGLPCVRHLVDEFQIISETGKGTRVIFEMRRKKIRGGES